MDFMRILRSLEELVYEVMSWIVFYPLAFVRTLFAPVRMLEHAGRELAKPEDQQFDDALSPPLFLMLSLLISHLIEIVSRPYAVTPLHELQVSILRSDENLVVFRSVLFGVFPLMFAMERTLSAGKRLTRSGLRPHVYAECFPAGVYALIVGVSSILLAWPQFHGLAITANLAISVWYVGLETVYRRRDAMSWPRALLSAFACFAAGWLIVVGVALGLSVATPALR